LTVGETASLIGAVATTLAVVVALLREEIIHLWRKPVLEARVHLGPPDCHKTIIELLDKRDGQRLGMAHCFYFRIWIENTGNQRAEKVQVFAAKLLRRHADGSFREEQSFLPMNLRWAHSQQSLLGPEIFAEGVSPHMGKHCDLGHMVDPERRAGFGHELDSVPKAKTILVLDLEVQPNTGSHMLAPGVYRMVLKLAAANARPVTTTIELNHTGDWFADEVRMFRDGIGITIVS